MKKPEHKSQQDEKEENKEEGKGLGGGGVRSLDGPWNRDKDHFPLNALEATITAYLIIQVLLSCAYEL